jgi:hypothetical protein
MLKNLGSNPWGQRNRIEPYRFLVAKSLGSMIQRARLRMATGLAVTVFCSFLSGCTTTTTTTTPVPRVTSPDSGNLLRVVAAIPNPNPLPINGVDQIDGTIDVYFNQAPTSPGTVYIRGKKPGLGVETPLGDASYSPGQTMIQVKITDFISPGTMPIRATVGYNDATAYQTSVTLVKGQ